MNRPRPGGSGMAREQERRRWQESVARVIPAVVTLAATWSVLAVVLRGPWRRAGEEVLGFVNLPASPNLFTVVLLVLLAGTLRRRLRLALWVLVVFQLLA